MSGHIRPLTCCDRECAMVNGCRMGGVECEGCGMWFCASDLDADGYCDRCAAERGEEDDDGEGDDND